MKAKKYWILVIVSFSILIVLWPAQQITGETDLSAKAKENDSILTALYKKLALSAEGIDVDRKEILQGLEGVWVLVATIEPEVERYGLTKKALQTDTELQLRQYGIKVLTREESLLTPGQPCLFVTVSVITREDIPTASVGITVELRETVLLLREPTRICIGASTWRRGGVVSVGVSKIKKIRGNAKDFVDRFINEYLAVNPKEIEAQIKNNN